MYNEDNFILLTEYASRRGIKATTLRSRIRRHHIPPDCVRHIGRTVLILDAEYAEPSGNKPGAARSGGGRKRRPPRLLRY